MKIIDDPDRHLIELGAILALVEGRLFAAADGEEDAALAVLDCAPAVGVARRMVDQLADHLEAVREQGAGDMADKLIKGCKRDAGGEAGS